MSSPSVKPAFVVAALGAVALLIGVGVLALGGTAALVAALTAGSPIGPEVPEGAPIIVIDDPDVAEPPAPAAEGGASGGAGGSVFGGLGGATAGGQDTAELVADAGDSGRERPAKAGKAGKAKSGKAKAGKAKAGKAKAGKGGKGKGKGAKAKAADAPAAPPPAPAKKECKPDSPYVEQTGERSWNVKESFVEKNSKDLDSAEKLANVGWARDSGGDIIGFKIRSLPCNSPLREAGFVKGDIIRSVNGKEIKSVSSAMRVGLEVRKAGNMKVRLTRKGASREHFYKMVK